MATLAPQAASQEVFGVLFLLLLLNPLALLAIGHCFEAQATDVEQQTKNVSDGEEWECGESRCWNAIDSENGE